MIQGKQGNGRNIFLDAIGKMIDKGHYITKSDPDDLFGTRSEGFYRKQLVNLNESEGKTLQFEGNIKSFITEPTLTANPNFFRPSTVNNHARLIITTSKDSNRN